IEHADLRGDVKINSDQLDMSSQDLALRFDPTAAAKGKHATTMTTSTQPAIAPTTLATTSPTTSPAETPASTLREIIANGDVKARITDAQQQRVQTIDAASLRVQTDTDPSGQTYAKQFQADGKVHTSDNGRTMDTEHLYAELAPTTRPAATTRHAT